MKLVGIFTPVAGFVQPLSINTGANGLVEIINATNYTLIISIFGYGEVYHFGRTQAIYKLSPNLQGAQTIQVAVAGAPGGIPSGGGPLAQQQVNTNPVLSGDNIGYPPKAQILINAYQQGEIDWYAPFGLGDPIFNTLTSQYAVTQATQQTVTPGTYTMTPLPAPNPFANSYIVLCGFDLSVDSNTTGIARGLFTIGGTQVTNTIPPLQWTVNSYLQGATPEKFLLSRTFTPPVIAYNNAGLTFNITTNLNGANWFVNIYYYGFYN